MPDTADLIDAAREAVFAAGRICRMVQTNEDRLREIIKDDTSPVTIADFASQAVVAYILSRRLGQPLDGAGALRLVGEETSSFLRNPEHAGHLAATLAAVQEFWPECDENALLAAIDAGAGDTGHAEFWTLDPIDGTKGFIRGEQYCVALAYIERGVPTVAAMACPNLPRDFGAPLETPDAHGCIYLAHRRGDSQAAWGLYELPGDDPDAQPLHINRLPRRPGSPIALVEPVESGHTSFERVRRVMARVGPTRPPVRIDSQCKYAIVARGQADCYVRLPRPGSSYVERIWDHAPGALIAAEGGCLVSDAAGRELDFSHGRGLERNRGIVVAEPELHGLLIEAIAAEGAAGDPLPA